MNIKNIDNDTVLIVGAGFSKGLADIMGYDFPLTNTFLKYAFNILKENKKTYEELFYFIKLFWELPEIDENTLEKVNIEDVLSIIDTRSDNEKINISENTFSTNELRNEVLELIYSTITEYTKKFAENKTEWKNKIVREFDNKFIKNHHNLAIISFNWDVLIDMILYDISNSDYDISHSDNLPDQQIYNPTYVYGFIPDMIWNSTDKRSPWQKPRIECPDTTRIKLLKLHGSLNYAICSECKRIYIFELYDFPNYRNIFKCPFDDATLNILLIPPTIEKNTKGYPFSAIWRKAFEALSNTTNIIIIGFSLREIDYQAKYLFQHSTVNNFIADNLHLTIIDPYYEQLKEKFVNIWKVQDNKINCFKSLNDYFQHVQKPRHSYVP